MSGKLIDLFDDPPGVIREETGIVFHPDITMYAHRDRPTGYDKDVGCSGTDSLFK